MKLDVHVKGKNVAQLYRERDEYVLKYGADAQQNDFVSLTMPVREEPWKWPRDLHPFFRQNLPEGYLLDVIREEFGPYLDGTDLSLLAVVGGMGVGRVTVTPEGVVPGNELEPLQVEDLLGRQNTADYFASLVRRYARAAISGAVPKFIAPEALPGESTTSLGKSTIRTSRHIIKGSDEKTPYLGFNEFYSMRVLERLGVAQVARTRMSDDGRVLIVDRFDVDENGVPAYGLEDACGLLGLPPHEKYNATTEKVLNAVRPYLVRSGVRPQLEQFGWLLLTNYVVRNADCHAKNIALYYTSMDDVSFTPAYNIVTTQAYPRFASNPPGLSVDGRKTWAPGKTLERFFNARLGIAPRHYAEMVERLCESAITVGHEIIEAARNEPQWNGIAKQMLHVWNDGMASLRSPKRAALFTGLSPAIEAAGFSEPEAPDTFREIIGRSELLAKPRAG
ncbi:toxin HipA [Caballeronia mineralivorans PML1(12)]|uniref:Toxin HipA n=1 Tax=Caballeronia mineralivorans PML1(12) TaxID=908627 RepID=A0A0J1CHD7_9BURK|nr:type II toxin-antitoxin system HipA family toxin [Caballeronia mineralivorans]KLU20115.1 toxin HipA [Caballeronia mineralivorans PML1(12)]